MLAFLPSRRALFGGVALMGGATAPGQQQFVSSPGNDSFTSTSTNFVVPSGIVEICAVTIEAGQQASDFGGGEHRSGAGGRLRYLNSIATTPGETLTVVGTGQGTFELRRGGTVLLSPGGAMGTGYAGGTFAQASGFPNLRGGGAAGYNANGGNGFQDGAITGGGGTSLLGGTAGGAGGGNATSDGGTYGGGAGISTSGVSGLAGPRGLRILWGPGRFFPNTNTGDL